METTEIPDHALGTVFMDIDLIKDLILIIFSMFVFFMQAGFAMLESGTVRAKNVQHIMFKNIMDASFGSVIWFVFGWAFASGEGTNGFIGLSGFCLNDTTNYATFFFGWAFCATSCTICSGSLAERVLSESYLVFVFFMTGFIYPIAAFWVWNKDGWLWAGNGVGLIDWAGSGVVHVIGGLSGLVGTLIVGPRIGRYEAEGTISISGHSAPLQVLGTLILWFGWYAFNIGSLFSYFSSGQFGIAGRIAVCTTLSSTSSAIMTSILSKVNTGVYSVTTVCNGVLGGLVSITAGCATVKPPWAFLIGAVASFVYFYGSMLLNKFKIDDPLQATAVHGFCGIWGLIAAGLFSDVESLSIAYKNADPAWLSRGVGIRLGHQLLGTLALMAWALSMSFIVFWALHSVGKLRVSEELERAGLDCNHGGGEGWLIVAKKIGRNSMNDSEGSIHIEDSDTSEDGNDKSPASCKLTRKSSRLRSETISKQRFERAMSQENEHGVTVDMSLRNDVQLVVMKNDAGFI